MKREDYPIYQAAIQFYLACENQSFTRLMESADLSLVERTLLRARKCFSQNQYKEAIDILETISSDCIFLTAEKHLLSATAYSNLGEWENSFLHNSRAIEGYKIVQDQRGHFLSTYNLSVDAGYLGLKKISNEHLVRAENLAVKLEEKLLVYRARACAMSADRNYLGAFEEIQKALLTCERLQDANTNILDVLTLKVVASDIFFRAGKIKMAKEILESIRHEKLLKPKARVFFNISLLKFLEGEKLGQMPKFVSESSEYSLKWNVLIALESGDMTQAKFLWQELIVAFPHNFKNDFEAATKFDQESIFFSCLMSIKSRVSEAPVVKFPIGSKMETLHKCLSTSKAPLRKEELIEMIWKCPYDPSYDSRFYKLIQRLKDLSLPITNEHRAYFYKSG